MLGGGPDIHGSKGYIVASVAEGDTAPDSGAVMVISVWRQGPQGFLGRLTTSEPDADRAVTVVASPDELLETVRAWLGTLT